MIDSFKIDHLRLRKGVYVSRVDYVNDMGITTYDIRVCEPYKDEPMDGAAAHSIEHIVANHLRNSLIGDMVIYFGPMGCMTGFYLILKGWPYVEQVAKVIQDAFAQVTACETVPGATKEMCGNYLYHDLPKARAIAERFINSPLETQYPK